MLNEREREPVAIPLLVRADVVEIRKRQMVSNVVGVDDGRMDEWDATAMMMTTKTNEDFLSG